jgi:SAM-dependent methyltransferase
LSGCGQMPSQWPGMLEAYSVLARFYDLCMDVDYEQWASYLLALCRRHGHTPSSIVDLGCGTGNLTIPLAEQGYRLTGVDVSWPMIAQAKSKAVERGLEIPFYVADLRGLRLGGAGFDTAISGCDVLNYFTTEADLRRALKGGAELVAPGGIWLFDLNTPWKLQEIYGEQSYADLRDDFAFFWDNRYDPQTAVCTMDLTFFVELNDGRYKRIRERHQQKAWLPEQIEQFCGECGLELLGCYDFLTQDPPGPEAERWQFVVKRS